MKILDCTLRDGGYCNQWKFGYDNIKKIIQGLYHANIDIIECGFITDREKFDPNRTKFDEIKEIKEVLPDRKEGALLVCMMNYGEYDPHRLPDAKDSPIDGIRLAFHKKDLQYALQIGETITEKGYLLFLQPMVTLNYTDEEFLSLIRASNELNPYAFYIVDSFGVMKQKDLIRLFYLVEHNLSRQIAIGFHSHNNMQLSFSNAQVLLGAGSEHELIIDASVFGMGRGAGNLNTELFVEYLNDNCHKEYQLKPLLTIIDEILNDFYYKNYWGYSLPNYLSAKHNTHPNYAGYLDSKKTLTIENMEEIFSMMEDNKRVSYDKEYIEQLYVQYLASGEEQDTHVEEMYQKISGKTVLLIAPGRSCMQERDQILKAAKGNLVSIGVNFDYSEMDTDLIFLSNLRRYRELKPDKLKKCIVTSNIPSKEFYLKTDYRELLNKHETIIDNAALMLIRFLIKNGCKKILLAGLDGYDQDPSQNYISDRFAIDIPKEKAIQENDEIAEELNELKKEVKIEFLTEPRYIHF